MTELTERQVCAKLHQWEKEGAKSRDTGEGSPYGGNSLAHYMHSLGWVKRDLQLALCDRDEGYRRTQIHDPAIAQRYKIAP